MLQLQAKELDICRISKLLVKYDVKASVSNQVITLEGEISDELLSQICIILLIDFERVEDVSSTYFFNFVYDNTCKYNKKMIRYYRKNIRRKTQECQT